MTDRLGLNKLAVIADVENATNMEEHTDSKLKHFLQVIPLEQLQLLIPISLYIGNLNSHTVLIRPYPQPSLIWSGH